MYLWHRLKMYLETFTIKLYVHLLVQFLNNEICNFFAWEKLIMIEKI